jgi:hypothetical protein
MALRDRLRTRVQPFLEPGEEIQAVWPGQAGPSPWFALLSYWILIYNQIAANFRVFVATDRAIVVLDAGRFNSMMPRAVRARVPRQVRLGPCQGTLWARIELDRPYWVHRRFFADVEQADAALAPGEAAAPPNG